MAKTVDAQCPTCKTPLKVIVGRKSTAREVTCTCGAKFGYSCWVIKQTEDRTFTKVELFAEAR